MFLVVAVFVRCCRTFSDEVGKIEFVLFSSRICLTSDSETLLFCEDCYCKCCFV